MCLIKTRMSRLAMRSVLFHCAFIGLTSTSVLLAQDTGSIAGTVCLKEDLKPRIGKMSCLFACQASDPAADDPPWVPSLRF
jgi:hypothetical protein